MSSKAPLREVPPALRRFGVSLDDVKDAVCRIVPSYAHAPRTALTLYPLTGGMSNIMLLVEIDRAALTTGATDAPLRVVARVLSPQLDEAIDRTAEHNIVKYVSTKGIGPTLYGMTAIVRVADSATPLSPSGKVLRLRVEEFVNGRTLNIEDLRANMPVVELMAKKVARLHAQRPNLDARVSLEMT
ncbi:hypothetical protein EON68_04655, partial [archaeon]